MRNKEQHGYSGVVLGAGIRILRLAGLSALLGLIAGAGARVHAAALQEPAAPAAAAQAETPAANPEQAQAVAEPVAAAASAAPQQGATGMPPAAAEAGKGKKDKKKKKEKPPKMTPLHVEQGTLTVDGWTGKARLNYDIADLKYIYVWAPGIGTVVASNQKFPLGKEEPNAFNGNNLTLEANGHVIQISSEKRLLKEKKPASAWVYLDTAYHTNAAFPQMGYGNSTAAPYAWPGAKDVPVDKGGVVAPPPLPAGMRPTMAKPACPAASGAAATTGAAAPAAACPAPSTPTSNSPSSPSTPPPVPLPGYSSGTTTAKVDPTVPAPPAAH